MTDKCLVCGRKGKSGDCLSVGSKEARKDPSEVRKNTQGDHLERQIIYEPPLTVDQLSAYRKRKPGLALPTDNLYLLDGSLKDITTEYQRCFRKFDPNLLPIICKRPKRNISFKFEGQHEFQSEYERSYVRPAESFYRPQLIRRCTNLKLEGDHYHVTAYRENFTTFLLEKKIKLLRRATTLQLQGQMNLETENRRNFVVYQNVFRPPLCKKLTNLHLSGSLHMDTESRDKFLRYETERRHPLTKIPTNLHLEGTLFLQPEYASAFVEYKNYEKPKPSLPVNNIKSPVDFVADSDSSENIKHPLIPHLRSYLYPHSDDPRRSSFRSTSRPNSRPPSRSSDRFIDVELDRSRADRKNYGLPTAVMIRNAPPKINISKPDERSYSRWSNRTRTQSVSPKPSSPRYFSKEEKVNNIAKSLPTLHRSKWKPRIYAESTIPHRSKPTSPEFQSKFECQPEYRRAYMNYITREKIPEQPYSGVSGWKNILTNDEAPANGLSPAHKKQLRKSSPKLSTHPDKSLDLMETAAFGRRCRNSSISEMSSSDDVFVATAKKSQIPRWSKLHTTSKKHNDLQEDSESEPAFVVMP